MRAQGGTIINLGSVLSETAVPLQGNYAATKFAVKAFTDTLRMELRLHDVPVRVSLVKPASIDTPFFDHARSYTGRVARAMPPVYAPELVAETILACAVKPVREVFVGGAAKAMAVMGRVAPALADRLMGPVAMKAQQRDEPSTSGRADNLYTPSADAGRVHGEWAGRVRRRSPWTAASLDPATTWAIVGGVAAATLLAASAIGRARATREAHAELPAFTP
jgi:hypothetical protein